MAEASAEKGKNKGGRPPKSGEGVLSKTMAFRLRPSLESQLRDAAMLEGRSMSEEVEARLNRSMQRGLAVAEMFGSEVHRPLILALCNAIRQAEALGNGGTDEDGVQLDGAGQASQRLQAYAAAIAIVQGLAKAKAADILNQASDTGHEWRDAAAGVLALERRMDFDEAAVLVDPPPRSRDPADLKEEHVDDAQRSTKARPVAKSSRRSIGEIMGR